MTGRLHILGRKGVGLAEAIAALAAPGIASDGAVALVYAPGFCAFARLNGNRLEGPPGPRSEEFSDRALVEGYEARIFCSAWELRWLKRGESGRAALLSDGEIEAAGFEPVEKPFGSNAQPDGCLAQTYLLWGEADGGEGGWTRLTTARIGALWVPIPGLPEKGRVQLHAREYLARCEHGNVVVAHERLRSLAPADGPAPTATKTKEKADG